MNKLTKRLGEAKRHAGWQRLVCAVVFGASCENEPECHDVHTTVTGVGPDRNITVRVCDQPNSEATRASHAIQQPVPAKAAPPAVSTNPTPTALSTWKDEPIRAPDRPANKVCPRDDADRSHGEFVMVDYGGAAAPTMNCVNRLHTGGARLLCGETNEIRVIEINVILYAHSTFIAPPTLPAHLPVKVREVQSEDGKWISVIADQDTGRIQRGDMLLAAGRGRWLSPPAVQKFFFPLELSALDSVGGIAFSHAGQRTDVGADTDCVSADRSLYYMTTRNGFIAYSIHLPAQP